MKKIDIWIKRKEIQNQVQHETTVLAQTYQARDQSQLLDSIIMDNDRLALFRIYFKEAKENVIDKCLAYCKNATYPLGEDDTDTTKLDEDLFLILEMPDNFPIVAASGIDKAIYSYLYSYIAYRWLQTRLPQEAAIYRLQADQNLSDICSRIERRIKPIRRPYRLF